MSDFVSDFWSVWVSAIVIIGIVGLTYLLTSQAKAPATAKHGEEAKTMGHVWDETLEEYNNPLPKWWMWMFYITLIFGVVYLALYPGLGSYKGIWNWTSAGEYEAERKAAEAKYQPLYDRYLTVGVEELSRDPEAREMGYRLFQTYCMQCHGADARGARGFPNLTDKDWLYGGATEKIHESIAVGRVGQMPAYGAAFGEEKVRDVANYVLSLSGKKHDEERALRGKETFSTVCVACHGAEGTGSQAIGAPNLTDNIWLYGSTEKTVMETITNGRNNQMPAWKEFLGDGKVHLLTAYVWGLSNNDKTAAAK